MFTKENKESLLEGIATLSREGINTLKARRQDSSTSSQISDLLSMYVFGVESGLTFVACHQDVCAAEVYDFLNSEEAVEVLLRILFKN